ncbi:MAG: cupredoxin domain-containing protein [Myxococcales bacterium]
MIALALLLALGGAPQETPDYLPSGPATAYLSVQRGGNPLRKIVVMTEAVAVKETGPRQTVERFGESYAFSPTFFAVRAGEPVDIEFWNLQADDAHDVLLVAPDQTVLMHWKLPALTKTVFTYTFKRPGIYPFICAMHSPEMAGQILVLPSRS